MPELDGGKLDFGEPRGPDLPKETNLDRIHRRARQLWEEAGRPQGRDDEFRRQAEREILGPA